MATQTVVKTRRAKSKRAKDKKRHSKNGQKYENTALCRDRRVYTDGRSKDFKQGWLSSLVAILTLGFMTMWMHTLLVMAYFWRTPWVTCLWVLILSSLLLPATKWNAFKTCYIFKSWREYFNHSYYCEKEPDPTEHISSLLCCFPHGVLPFGMMAAGSIDKELFPFRNPYAVVGSSVFAIPIYRHIVGWMGGVPASKGNIRSLLRKVDTLVFLFVGGIAEMFFTRRDKEQVLLRNRKGFIRAALITGVEIVPVYVFGQSQLLTLVAPEFLRRISRKLGLAVGFMHGRWGLPIPRRQDIWVVSGWPIQVDKRMHPDDPCFEPKVTELHEIFISELQRLYDTYKGTFGWADRPLEIL